MTFIILVSLLHVQSIQSLSDAIFMELKVNDIPHSFEKVSLKLIEKHNWKQINRFLILWQFCTCHKMAPLFMERRPIYYGFFKLSKLLGGGGGKKNDNNWSTRGQCVEYEHNEERHHLTMTP